MRSRRRRNSKEHRELGRWESNSHWHRNTLEFTKIKGRHEEKKQRRLAHWAWEEEGENRIREKGQK